jgi:hypothetical protein
MKVPTPPEPAWLGRVIFLESVLWLKGPAMPSIRPRDAGGLCVGQVCGEGEFIFLLTRANCAMAHLLGWGGKRRIA